MDGSRFDRMTRQMASGTSRRRFIGGLAAGIASLAGVGAAEASRGKSRKNCMGAGGVCSWYADCCSGSSCIDGYCCQSKNICNGSCCTEPDNGTSYCNGYYCEITCNEGYKQCNGTCIPNWDCCDCGEGYYCYYGDCYPYG